MKTTLILGSILLGPGLLIGLLWRSNFRGPLLAILLSYGLFISFAHGFQYLSLETYFGPVIVAVSSFCLLTFGVIAVRRIAREWLWSLDKMKFNGYLPVLTLSIVYAVWAGAYLEIPADVWRHLGLIGDYTDQIRLGVLNLNQPWYLMYATALSVSGEPLIDSIELFAIFATGLWLVAVVDFTRLLFRSIEMNDYQRLTLFFLSAVLTLVMFGTSSFSFTRYYTFSPAYFSFLIFFLGIVIFAEMAKTNGSRAELVSRGGIFLACLAVTYLVHKQETLFLGAFTIGYGIYSIFSFGKKHLNACGGLATRGLCSGPRKGHWIVFIFLLVASTATLITLSESGLLEVQTGLINNTLIVSSELIGDRKWVIADPVGRVFETVNLWGIAAISCYFGYVQKRYRHPVISVLIVTPVFFLFNPLFNDFFLSYATHDVLWRFAYMVPVGVIGAHVLVLGLGMDQARGMRASVVAAVLGALLISLPGMSGIQNLRWSSLGKVESGNSYTLWGDLIDKLERISPRNILTDPVTGYVVRALTKHQVFGFKFHSGPPFIPINYAGYGDTSFSGFDTWLFIQNNRDGAGSINGKISGHWPESIMSVSQAYSDLLTEFLEDPPDHFVPLWESKGIRLFEIRAPKG